MPDLAFMIEQENKLTECVHQVREAMHELATTSVIQMMSETELRHAELMQLYGAVTHRCTR